MAVVQFLSLWEDRTGTWDDKFAQNRFWSWLVITDDKDDDQEVVLSYEEVPAKGDPWSDTDEGSTILAVDHDVKQLPDSPYLWKLTVRYSTDAIDPSKQQLDPLDRPPDVQWGREDQTVTVWKDANGDPILNTAGDPFEKGMDTTRGIRTLVIARNEEAYDAVATQIYENRVNTVACFGYEPGEVLSKSIVGASQYEMGERFFKVTYSFRIKLGGWKRVFLNQGMRFIDAGTGDLVAATEANGSPSSRPVLLSILGTKLDPGDDPVYIEVEEFLGIDFNDFNLSLE